MMPFAGLARVCRASSHLLGASGRLTVAQQLTSLNKIIHLPQRGIFDRSTMRSEFHEDKSHDYAKRLSQGRSKEECFSEIRYILDNDPSRVVHNLDLKLLASQATERSDFDLIEDFISKTHDWFEEKYTYGTKVALMRSLYLSQNPDRAYHWITEMDRFGKFFREYEPYRIAMTMLYDSGRYDDVVHLYDHYEKHVLQSSDEEMPLPLVWIAMASLAKVCSPNAYEKAKRICKLDPDRPGYHSYKFLSFMAIEHGEASLAIYLTTNSKFKTSNLFANLELSALVKMERYHIVLARIREMIDGMKKPFLTRELFDNIQTNMYNTDDDVMRDKLDRELQYISRQNLIIEQDLESLVFEKLHFKSSKDDNLRKEYSSQSHSHSYRRGPRSKHNNEEPNWNDE